MTLRELRDEVGNDAARFFYVLVNASSIWILIWIWQSQSQMKIRFIIFSTHMHEFAVLFRQLERKNPAVYDQSTRLR